MKQVVMSVLAASALMLGACATTADESAALRADEKKAELAAVSQEIMEINARVRGQVVLGTSIRAVMQDRALAGRLMGLVDRQRELRAELEEAGYPRTAEEVRAKIMEIDLALAKRGVTLAPAGSPGKTSSLRSLVSSSPYLSTTTVIDGPNPYSYVVSNHYYQRMGGTPGSSSPRSLEWQRIYSLKEERAALHARLQTLERFEN